jgi:rhodanese-related sulfurtransferase
MSTPRCGRLGKDFSALALLILLCFTVWSPFACSQTDEISWSELKQRIRDEFPNVRRMSTEELAEILESGQSRDLVLLDARSGEEYSVSHLAGAHLTPDLETALRVLDEESQEMRIVVYCSVGYRSSRLAEQLQDRGYEEVYNLEGSIFEWVNQGRTVEGAGGSGNRVHPYDRNWGRYLNRDLWSEGF